MINKKHDLIDKEKIIDDIIDDIENDIVEHLNITSEEYDFIHKKLFHRVSILISKYNFNINENCQIFIDDYSDLYRYIVYNVSDIISSIK